MESKIRDIAGYEGLYQITSDGRVISLRDNEGRARVHELSARKNRSGYLYVNLYKDRVRRTFTVHRLVALAFISNDDPEHKTCINHKDENKLNNTVVFNDDGSINTELSNLEWCDYAYNNKYGSRIKRSVISHYGVDHVFGVTLSADYSHNYYENNKIVAIQRAKLSYEKNKERVLERNRRKGAQLYTNGCIILPWSTIKHYSKEELAHWWKVIENPC